MIQALAQLATHALALLLYPGLVTMALFGVGVESVWMRVCEHRWVMPDLRWHPPSAVLTTVTIAAMLASVQLSPPFQNAG